MTVVIESRDWKRQYLSNRETFLITQLEVTKKYHAGNMVKKLLYQRTAANHYINFFRIGVSSLIFVF